MRGLGERFNDYVRVDTTANPAVAGSPSSAGQRTLLEQLANELSVMGLKPDLRQDLLLVRVPASAGHEQAPCVGFVAHVDTSPELPGAAKPIVHRAYDGGDIRFPDDPDLVLRPSEHPALAAKRGHDIVTASGLTLLGADDKAGVAILMTLAARFMSEDIAHGPVALAFTTDEEIGRGADGFDIEAFGAVAAYTLDGGEIGELESENFNASEAVVTFTGFNTHPGYAKGKMANASRALGHFLASLPADLSPEHTDDRQGFLHPHAIEGGVERAIVHVLLRDFDTDAIRLHAGLVDRLARDAASKVEGVTCTVEITDQYRNMHDVLVQHPHVVDFAEQAIRAAGITVIRKPIRGGTDGAKLSAMGLPTPNLFSGQHNIHSRLEWISIQDMETAVDVCIHLCRIWAASQLPATRV